jgi:hypothetical protein
MLNTRNRFTLRQFVSFTCLAALFGLTGQASAAGPAAPKAPAIKPSLPKSENATPGADLKSRVEEMRIARDNLDTRINELTGKQRDLRDSIIETCGLSPENVLPTLLALEKERFNLAIKVELERDRAQNLADWISRNAKESDKQAGSDPVLQNLKKIVELRKKSLSLAEEAHKTNLVTSEEVANREAELAEAQIRAELRTEQLAQAVAHARTYTQQQVDLGLELQQDEARLSILDKKLKGLKGARDLLDPYNRVTEELPPLNQRLQRWDFDLQIGSELSH